MTEVNTKEYAVKLLELLDEEIGFLKAQPEDYYSDYLLGVIRGIELSKTIISNKISWTDWGKEEENNG